MIGDETVRVGAQLHGGPRLETLVGGDEPVHVLGCAAVRLDQPVDERAAGILVHEADVRQDGQEAEVDPRGQRGGLVHEIGEACPPLVRDGVHRLLGHLAFLDDGAVGIAFIAQADDVAVHRRRADAYPASDVAVLHRLVHLVRAHRALDERAQNHDLDRMAGHFPVPFRLSLIRDILSLIV